MSGSSARGSWAAVFGCMALIFIVSSMQFGTPFFRNAEKFHIDWMAHIVEYTVLGFLLARALLYSAPPATKRGGLGMYVLVMLIGVLYAASDEYHQSLVPTRDASVQDGIADTIGLSLGCWIRLKKRKS